jgi:hypothetical protein
MMQNQKNDFIFMDYPDIIGTQKKITETSIDILNKMNLVIYSSLYNVSIEAIEIYKKNNSDLSILTVDENIKNDLILIDRKLKIENIKNKLNNVSSCTNI